jgi:hypothetical protein
MRTTLSPVIGNALTGQGLFAASNHAANGLILREYAVAESVGWVETIGESGLENFNNRMLWSLVETVLRGKLQAVCVDMQAKEFFLRAPMWDSGDERVVLRLNREYGHAIPFVRDLYARLATYNVSSRTRSWYDSNGNLSRCPAALGLFPLNGKLNHSCEPNCEWVISQHIRQPVELRAIDPIVKGEELTVAYTNQTREHAYALFGFVCKCRACRACRSCGQPSATRWCPCHTTCYCSRACFSRDWHRHKNSRIHVETRRHRLR